MSFANVNAPQSPEDLQKQLAALQAQLAQAQAQPAAIAVPAPAPAPVQVDPGIPEATEAPKRTRGRPPKAAAAAPEPEVREPEVIPQTTAIATPMGSLMALFAPENQLISAEALESFDDDAGGSEYLFPELHHEAKANVFKRAKHMQQGDGMNMPEGSDGFYGVLMGYRFRATAWPQNYDGAAKTKPVYSVAISASDVESINAMKPKARDYQYTKAEEKDKWDYATTGIGHTRCCLEILVYDPEDNSLFVLCTASHFSGTELTRDEILKNLKVDPQTGRRVFQQFPAAFTPTIDSSAKNKRGRVIDVPYVKIECNMTSCSSELQGAYQAFKEFIKDNNDNEELGKRVEEWLKCADDPVNDIARACWAK